MADQTNTVTYQLDVRADAAQMAIAQTLQSAKHGIFAGLTEPVDAFMGAGQANVAQQHTMSAQRIQAGWAGLQTAATEYTQRGFYQQMIFGTQPQFAGGARNAMTLQHMAATMPFQAGLPSNAAEMRHFSEAVMQPFSGLLGFQEPYAQTLAGAAAAGLSRAVGGPGQLAEAATQLGALTAGMNKVYGVGGAESGALYTQMLASGVPLGQAQATYEATIRAEASGVPAGQSMAAISQYERQVRSRERLGMGGGAPGGGIGYSAADVVGGELEGKYFQRQLQNRGYSMTSEDAATYNRNLQQMNMMNHGSDAALESNRRNSALVSFGALANQLDFDRSKAGLAADELVRASAEERSATISGLQDIAKNALTGPGLFGSAVAAASDLFAPPGTKARIAAAMGYSQPSTVSNVKLGARDALIAAQNAPAFGQEAKYNEAEAAIAASAASKDLNSSGLLTVISGMPEKERKAALEAIGRASEAGLGARLISSVNPKNWTQVIAGNANQGPMTDAARGAVERYAGALAASGGSLANMERGAMRDAGLDALSASDPRQTLAMQKEAGRLELEIIGESDPVKRGKIRDSAIRDFRTGVGAGDPKNQAIFSRMAGDADSGSISQERRAGLANLGSIENAAIASRSDVMMGTVAQAKSWLEIDEKKRHSTDNDQLISRLTTMQENAVKRGGFGPASVREFQKLTADSNMSDKQRQMMMGAWSDQTNAARVSPGAPDFGNFGHALVTASDALRKVSGMVSSLTAGKLGG